MTELTPTGNYKTSDLILGALKLLGIEEAGETSTDEDMTDGLFFLNLLLDEWSVDRAKIFSRVEDVKTLTIGTGAYTVGDGGDINTVLPISVEQCFIRNTTLSPKLDYKIDVSMTQQEYNDIPIKTIQTIPTRLFYLKNYPLGTITLDFLPNLSYEMHLFSWKRFTAFDDINTTVALPDGYSAALTYNLAVRFSPAFGKQLRPDVISIAQSLSRAINDKVYELPHTKLQGVPGYGGSTRVNIYNPFMRS